MRAVSAKQSIFPSVKCLLLNCWVHNIYPLSHDKGIDIGLSVQCPKWLPILFVSEIRQIILAPLKVRKNLFIPPSHDKSRLVIYRESVKMLIFFFNTPLSNSYAQVLNHTSNSKYVQNVICSGFTTRSWNRHLLTASESHQSQRKSIYQLMQNYLLLLILSVNLHLDDLIFSFKVCQESIHESWVIIEKL